MMAYPLTDDSDHHRVIVIASSLEGIDALARLVHQLPPTFPLPVVVQIHGLKSRSINRLTRSRWQLASRVDVAYAQDRDRLGAGRIYVIPAEDGLVFTARGVLGYATDVLTSNADDLFKSAALWYGAGVIGVVLSGLGTDGTMGLQAITDAQGVRIVQSPTEAVFPS
ncbi:MAG: chemotaxis protein CheB, partial [Proteobacteria bacterium]